VSSRNDRTARLTLGAKSARTSRNGTASEPIEEEQQGRPVPIKKDEKADQAHGEQSPDKGLGEKSGVERNRKRREKELTRGR